MRVYIALPFLMTPLLSACGDATGSLVGGDSLTMTTPSEAGTAPTGDGGVATIQTNADCVGNGAHAGTTWSDLYACYFGPSGTDSCAGTGSSCHGDMGSAGGTTWVCGSSAATCYAGMMGQSLIAPQGTKDLTMNGLYSVLCGSPNGFGSMPLGCSSSQTLLSGDFGRVAAWIAAGAPQN